MDDAKGELLARTEGKDRLIVDQVDFTKPIRKIHGIREINEKGQMVHVIFFIFFFVSKFCYIIKDLFIIFLDHVY